MASEILTSQPMRLAETLARPSFSMPANACDVHVHVFAPELQYPRVPNPHYTLPDGNLVQLARMTAVLGLQRFVIVQPSFYDTDNRCLLDALDMAGSAARGVAMLEESIGGAELELMHARGVRALRLDLFKRATLPTSDILAYIQRSVRQVKHLGWHLQFYTPGWVVRDLIPHLAGLDVDFVIDHMGYMLESDGLTRADFDRLLRAVQEGRGWMKLSGVYRLAKDGNYDRLKPLARAIVDAVPERTVWGSDWPHIPEGGRDTGQYLNLLADWVPDELARQRILVDNPGRLFGF